jgi:hypothetical protein
MLSLPSERVDVQRAVNRRGTDTAGYTEYAASCGRHVRGLGTEAQSLKVFSERAACVQ